MERRERPAHGKWEIINALNRAAFYIVLSATSGAASAASATRRVSGGARAGSQRQQDSVHLADHGLHAR
jgi:hypothetical protein